jgi:hypothetical protein
MKRWKNNLFFGLVLGAIAAGDAGSAYAEKPAFSRAEAGVVLLSENKGAYKVVAGDTQLDEIDVYVNPTGAFIPLDSLLSKLGYSFYRDDASEMAQITFADGSTLTLNFEKGEYTRRGSTNSLQSTDYILIGPYFYLNTTFMNKVFPIGFSLDQAARKLRIQNAELPPVAAVITPASPPPPPPPSKYENNNRPRQSMAAATLPPDLPMVPLDESDNYPVPVPAPRLPVIVDDFMRPGARGTPKVAEQGQDVISQVEPAPPVVPPVLAPVVHAENGGGDGDNTLILQPQIKRAPPSDQLIEAIELGGILYLPLDDMMALLEFEIKTDASTGTATGTFMAPARSFALNIGKNTVQIAGETQTLGQGEAIKQNGHIYISSAAFEKWFGISAALIRQTMVLKLDSTQALPLESRMERHKLWEKLLTASGEKPAGDFIKIQNPYRLVAWPSIDVDLSSSYRRGGNTPSNAGLDASYAVLTGGDLAYMTTNFFATGTREKPITNLRLTAGRKDPDGGLLGVLHATNFSIGDIESPTLADVASDPNGRGALVSNRALNASSGFDTHTFTGNAVPGWEVELYQNKTLLAFQTVGTDGRYTFLDVPLLYGNNDFRIVLYGPQGQTEDRVETILVGDSMLKQNKFEYTFSASQKELRTLDSLSALQSSATASSGIRAISALRYGVTKHLTAGVGFAQTTVPQTPGENIEHRYASASLDAVVGGSFVNLNAVRDINGGWMAGVIGLTSIDDISIRMRHRQFNKFVSETESATNQHKAVSEISANGQFYLPIFRDFNIGLKATRETFATQPTKTTYSNTFAKSIWGTSFSNTLDYIASTETQARGTAGWQARIGRVLVRADGHYEVKPTMQFDEASLTTQYRLGKHMTAQTKIDKQLNTDKTITLSQSLNWDFRSCRLSLAGDVNDNHEAHVGLNLVFSLARDPAHDEWRMQRQSTANSGSIATSMYEDDNYDGQYDDSKRVIKAALPRVNNLPLPDGAADGAFISPITPYEPINISVDSASLKDPMLSPGSAGYRVTTRPGDVVSIHLPVISTSEVDGDIAIADETGIRKPLPDIVVELIDHDGHVVKRVVSETDGYFIFQKLRPGDYTLSVPAEALAEYDATLATPLPVRVGKQADFYTGNNLLLHTKLYQPHQRKKNAH